MRFNHKAGEKLFVDFSGLTVPWIDKKTGQEHTAEIFVAVLGASNYTYVEASADQALASWILVNIHTLEFFGGVPEIAVPDNLRVGITKAHYYDPDVNATYQEFSCHYGMAIVPARAVKPRDKAKAEVGFKASKGEF
jgi:transposase